MHPQYSFYLLYQNSEGGGGGGGSSCIKMMLHVMKIELFFFQIDDLYELELAQAYREN